MPASQKKKRTQRPRTRPHRKQRPNPKSLKRRKEEVQYRKASAQFLIDHPYCEFWLRHKGVKVEATEVHHTRGRAGSLYLNSKFWAAVSTSGHARIHNGPQLARELGLIGPWGKQT